MRPETKIIQINERQTYQLRHSDLWDEVGRSKLLSEARELKALSIFEGKSGPNIRLHGLVGYLPITPHLVLDIRPRFPITGLWDMLSIAGDDFVRVIQAERGYGDGPNSAPPLVLARAFCNYLTAAMSKGLPRTYENQNHQGYFEPKIDVGATLKNHISRGDYINVAANVTRFRLDSLVNRVLKSACKDFYSLIPNTDKWFIEKTVLNDALQALSSVKDVSIYSTDLEAYRQVNSRLFPDYKGLFTTYKLLKSGGGFTFEVDPKGSYLPSFFFKLDDVFERFVRNGLNQGLSSHGLKALDGNISRHQNSLFTDNKIYKVKPDLIFKRMDNSLVGLGEVKYKPKIKETDRYQVISHSVAYSSPISIIFSPVDDGSSQRIMRIGKLTTGTELYHYLIDLTKPIHTSLETMINDISSFFE